ncbi:CMBL Carboxymethylenebutenolidase, partial [Neodrepanis coruscans]|nr:CMBL Carboxymethylenebutenolidase [Neodrepanis coruscans]
AICPDFFVGQEAWKPSNDWASFNDWLKTRNASKIDKYSHCSLSSKWTVLFYRNFCLSREVALDPELLVATSSRITHCVCLYMPCSLGVIRHFEDKSDLLHPTFFIFGEKDDIIPLEQVIDYEVKIYPGQTHGFVHRKREDINPQDKPYIEEGRKDMINWLNKYL